MRHDRLYQHILDGLGRELDGRQFEDCAVDLLRSTYPGLTPIRGGNDVGMDGALADEDGQLPLICTTQENVLANLRGSLTQYLERRTGPKKAIVATSRRVAACGGAGPATADMDAEREAIWVLRGKGGRARTVRIDRWGRAELARWLGEHREKSWTAGDMLFCTALGGPVTQAYVRRRLPEPARAADPQVGACDRPRGHPTAARALVAADD